MAEFDSVTLTNPTSEDFSWRFNGELYTIKAKETKSFSKYCGFHLAKHLSTKMIDEKNPQKNKKNATSQEINIEAIRHSQLLMYDNPQRRIALYEILGDVQLVQELLMVYPFKAFIGEMKEYEDYVNSVKSRKGSSGEKDKVE